MRRGSPEEVFENRPDKLSEAEEKLYRLIVPEHKASAPELNEFVDLYGAETVETDKKLVAEREAQFAAQEKENPFEAARRRRGELFEAILNNQIESSNWFGEKAEVKIPSRFDDIVNGIDSVVEFGGEEKGGERIAMTVDITKDAASIDKKFAAVKSAIDAGRLSRIKYLRGAKEAVRVVIGADQRTMQDVAELLLLFKTRQKFPRAGRPGEFRETRNKLETHNMRFYILLEIREQLQAFADYAERTGKKNAAEEHRKMLSVFSEILEQGKEAAGYGENLREVPADDAVYQKIVGAAEKFGK